MSLRVHTTRCHRSAPVLAALAAAILLAGCARLNTGWTDYRRARDPVAQQTAVGLDAMYFQDQRLGARIVGKDESIVVRLLQAHICDFAESGDWLRVSPYSPCSNGSKSSFWDRRGSRGEIAVILNANERANGAGLNFRLSEMKKTGRLVYYSPDVREYGQLLNFNNMPIYGPKTYSGAPFFMDFHILELDNEEAQSTKAMLSTLSGIGASAYPPAAPILKILNSLGSALLSGEQDDLEARYTLEFDPPRSAAAGDDAYRAPLMTGVYAFVRQEVRNHDFDWSSVCLDYQTGRLLVNDPETGCGCRATASTGDAGQATDADDTTEAEGESGAAAECDSKVFRDRTWWTVRIGTGESPVAQDAGQLFSEFIQASGEIQRSSIPQVVENLTELGKELSFVKKVDDVRDIAKNLTAADESGDVARNFVANKICGEVKLARGGGKLARLVQPAARHAPKLAKLSEPELLSACKKAGGDSEKMKKGLGLTAAP